MILRPCVSFVQTNGWRCEEFRFSNTPVITVDAQTSGYCSDDTDVDADPDQIVTTSWHHRAIIGDNKRILYTDPDAYVSEDDDDNSDDQACL